MTPEQELAVERREHAQLRRRFNHLAEEYAELRQAAWDAAGIASEDAPALAGGAALPDLASYLRRVVTHLREDRDELAAWISSGSEE